MNEPCELCGELNCGCAEWFAHWASLTPEQRRAEIRQMDRYAIESTNQ